MASSLPSKFPPSTGLIRPPESCKLDGFKKSTVSPTINRPDSRRISSDQTGIKGSLVDRRSHAPLRINLLATTEEPHDIDREPKTPTPTAAFHPSSSPIPIPSRQKHPAVTTPLTAREPKGGHFPFGLTSSPEVRLNMSNSVNYHKHRALEPAVAAASSKFDNTSHRQHRDSQTGKVKSKMHDQPSSHYNPSSPRSPALPLSPLQPMGHNSRLSRGTNKNLKLTSLPRFHPANYQSSEAHSIQPPRGSRPGTSQRHLSDAQQKLQQYQRDLVTNTTKTSRSLISQNLTHKPSPPRLHPLGSPGPVTPMTLEGHGDYLAAGSPSTSQPFPATEERDWVGRIIRQENDRMKRPGIHSRTHSPAVSPAAGRG